MLWFYQSVHVLLLFNYQQLINYSPRSYMMSTQHSTLRGTVK